MATKLYIDTNLCFVGDKFFPKGHIKGKTYESNTKIRLWDIFDSSPDVPLFDGLVTELTESDGTPYADWSAVKVVLQSFFIA